MLSKEQVEEIVRLTIAQMGGGTPGAPVQPAAAPAGGFLLPGLLGRAFPPLGMQLLGEALRHQDLAFAILFFRHVFTSVFYDLCFKKLYH